MIELIFAADDLNNVRGRLIGKGSEGSAILFANPVVTPDSTSRLLIHDLYFPAEDEYSRRGPLEAELKPEVVARVSKQASRDGSSLVFVHSHPGDSRPEFSRIDDSGEEHLLRFLKQRTQRDLHGALVVSHGGICARKLGTQELARVISVGESRRIEFDPTEKLQSADAMFDRQVRMLGADGQRALSNLRVAVVGLGGIGAIVAQQLVHLGVRNFILIDPDTVEITNLNRLPNATAEDIGVPKVDVAARYLRSISSQTQIKSIAEDVIHVATARKLIDADLIFSCTDSHGSRAIIQQVSYQFLVPCIDIGTVITAAEGKISGIFGRVQLLAPGLACLTCSGLLDPGAVRTDMMTAFERKTDPYVSGAQVPAPAVMSLNGTAASLGITMLLSVVAELPAKARYLLYNAISSSLRSVRGEPEPDCFICSRRGSVARGDSWPIFGRQD